MRPFVGHGTTGFDPATGKYVGTWIDSWSPTVMHLEGSCDASGKVLTMTGMAPGPDCKPMLVMTIVQTRQPAKSKGR